MANLSKLKRPNSLGAPPPLNEATENLMAPEVAPGATILQSEATITLLRKPETAAKPQEKGHAEHRRLDGRSLRKSGRLIPFATRVSFEFDERVRKIAQRDRLLLVEVLERGLDAYEGQRGRG